MPIGAILPLLVEKMAVKTSSNRRDTMQIRHRFLIGSFVLFALILAGLALTGCGGSGDDDDDCAATDSCGPDAGMSADAMAPDAMIPDAVPPDGHITIVGDNITGATGKVILAFILADSLQGAVCVAATSNPMSFSAVVKTPADGNPCDLGADVVFPDGTYNVYGGIYTPGQQTPDLCANTTVTVAGTGEATLPEFGPCL